MSEPVAVVKVAVIAAILGECGIRLVSRRVMHLMH
jgi:hypothetical protein